MGGDIKGGGMTIYENNTEINPNLVYGEGLTVPRLQHAQLDGLYGIATWGKIKSYDRVRYNILFHY